MEGCSNRGGKNYYKHLASEHKGRKTAQTEQTEQAVKPVKTVKPVRTVKPVKTVKTVGEKKEDKKEVENSGLCNVDYCEHCKLLEMRLRKYAVYMRRKHENSDLASWCDLFSNNGIDPADYGKVMAVIEKATLIKAAHVSRKTFAQRPAGVAPHAGCRAPPNPVLAPRRILEAEKDGAPIRNVPDASAADLSSIAAPIIASVPPPPGFGALSNLVRVGEQQSADAHILKVRQVPDAPLASVPKEVKPCTVVEQDLDLPTQVWSGLGEMVVAESNVETSVDDNCNKHPDEEFEGYIDVEIPVTSNLDHEVALPPADVNSSIPDQNKMIGNLDALKEVKSSTVVEPVQSCDLYGSENDNGNHSTDGSNIESDATDSEVDTDRDEKKQKLFNMDANVAGKRSSEDEFETDVKQPVFPEMSRKARVTKRLREMGAYKFITDDQCPLVKEFRQTCTLHAHRSIKHHAKCVQKMLYWCLTTNEDGSPKVPAPKEDEPVDILILFNSKKTRNYHSKFSIDAMVTSSTIRLQCNALRSFTTWYNAKLIESVPQNTEHENTTLLKNYLEVLKNIQKEAQTQVRPVSKINTASRMEGATVANDHMDDNLIQIRLFYLQKMHELNILINTGPEAISTLSNQELYSYSLAIACHICLLNGQRPAVASNMTVSNFTADITVVNTRKDCKVSDVYAYIPVAEHKTGSKLTATVSLTRQDYAFYDAYYQHVRPILQATCLLAYQEGGSGLRISKEDNCRWKDPIETHLDCFLLNSNGFSMEEMSNCLRRAQANFMGIELNHCVSQRQVRSYVASRSEVMPITEKDRQHVCRYLGHSMVTHKTHYVAPEITTISLWKTCFDRVMPDLPQSIDYMDRTVQLREHIKIHKAKGSLYNTKQWCKVMFLAHGFDPKSIKDVKLFGDKHKCLWTDKECKQILTSIIDGKSRRMFMQEVQGHLRMRSTNFITPKELVQKIPGMRENLATTLLANATVRSDKSGSPCTDPELLQKSAARQWPLASVQNTATAADGTKIGKGVYATAAIDPTTFVCQYYVHKKFVLNSKEHKAYEKREAPSSNYCIISGQGKYFHDAWKSKNNKGMYINHSRIHANLDLVLKKIKSAPNLLRADHELLLFRANRRIEAGEQLVWDYTSGERLTDQSHENAAAFPGQEIPDFFGTCIGKCWKCVPRERPTKLDKDIFENVSELLEKFQKSKIPKSRLSPKRKRGSETAMPVSSDTSPVARETRKAARQIVYSDSDSDSDANGGPLAWSKSTSYRAPILPLTPSSDHGDDEVDTVLFERAQKLKKPKKRRLVSSSSDDEPENINRTPKKARIHLNRIDEHQKDVKVESNNSSTHESTDSSLSKRESTGSSLSKRELTDSSLSKRESTDSSLSKRESTDSSLSKRESTDSSLSKRESTDSSLSKRESTDSGSTDSVIDDEFYRICEENNFPYTKHNKKSTDSGSSDSVIDDEFYRICEENNFPHTKHNKKSQK